MLEQDKSKLAGQQNALPSSAPNNGKKYSSLSTYLNKEIVICFS
jgi:hypothetical protein